ncbi:MAG TPA: RNA polymerase sigma factor [Armatimonadaceae bacterium]|nr:RNA polymerase sigma factor [Armatimonadaceae bacterium]
MTPPRSGAYGGGGDSAYESRLIERFKSGDSRALETLFDRYADRTLGLAVRLTDTREDAEEVAQEAFLRAFRFAREMRGDTVTSFGAWLFSIVRSLAADRRRQLKLPALISLAAPELEAVAADAMDVGEEAARRAERADLLQALDALPEEYRAVLTLCDLEDVPHAEAAQVLGRSPAATKSLLYRARRALRDRLAERWKGVSEI